VPRKPRYLLVIGRSQLYISNLDHPRRSWHRMALEGASSGEWEWADNTQELDEAAQAFRRHYLSNGTGYHAGCVCPPQCTCFPIMPAETSHNVNESQCSAYSTPVCNTSTASVKHATWSPPAPGAQHACQCDDCRALGDGERMLSRRVDHPSCLSKLAMCCPSLRALGAVARERP